MNTNLPVRSRGAIAKSNEIKFDFLGRQRAQPSAVPTHAHRGAPVTALALYRAPTIPVAPTAIYIRVAMEVTYAPNFL